MDRLHAHWDWLDVVRCLSATLAGVVRVRDPCRWNCPGPARADYRRPRTIAFCKPKSAHPYIGNLKASTVMGPAARLPNQQAVHHAGFDDPRTGRRFQAVSRSARTSYGLVRLQTSCSHASYGSGAVGSIPRFGPSLGFVTSFLDAMLGTAIPKSGVAGFLPRAYPSLFDRN